ncbi:MAG: acetylxylan esterase, partial [Planctomycetia bacterium]|nr:acetylxylan esterase [Planctomycetia bacterium]
MTFTRRVLTCVAILVSFFVFVFSIKAAPPQNQSKQTQQPKEPAGLLARCGFVSEPQQMVSNYLLDCLEQTRINWQAKYDAVVTPEDVLAYQKSRVDYFRRQLGTMWDKTPLNAKVIGTIQKEGVRIEKILFESVPGFYVTATMYLPSAEKYKPPYPAILGVCGHNNEGKAAARQILADVFAAQCGLAMLVIDPIDQGERLQHLNADGKPYAQSVPGHNLLGVSSILLGRNTATFEVWDMIRAIDYLQSRNDIIPDKIGAAGCSGGGTQTSYIMALDERIAAAAPSCYTCSLFGKLGKTLSPQDAEQNIFGQLAAGIDHVDYSIMRAPKPTLLCTSTKDFFNITDAWDTYRLANRFYTRLGLPERMCILESDDPHGYWPAHRVGTVRFMLRWLAGRDEAVTEPENLPVVTEEEIRVLPLPGIMGIKNARTTYDLNRDLETKLKEDRHKRWSSITATQAQDLLRSRAQIASLDKIPAAAPYLVDGGKSQLVLSTRNGIYLPVQFNQNKTGTELTLYID